MRYIRSRQDNRDVDTILASIYEDIKKKELKNEEEEIKKVLDEQIRKDYKKLNEIKGENIIDRKNKERNLKIKTNKIKKTTLKPDMKIKNIYR